MKTKAHKIVITSLAALTLLSACAGSGQASSDEYPHGPIEYISPYSTGGSTDPISREFSRLLTEELGTTAVVRNVPGADEVLGITEVANSDPDGMTLGLASIGGAVGQPLIHDDVDFDYTPIARMTETPYMLLVHPESEYETLDDFIDDAKDRPGEVGIGLSGPYGGPSLTALNLQEQAGVDFNFVPFSDGSGSSALAVMSGEVEATMTNAAGQAGLVESGDLKALAHSGAPDYNDYLPGAVSFSEAGYDIAIRADHMTIGPANMPDDVRETLEEAAAAVLASDEWNDWAHTTGNVPGELTGKDLEEELDSQVEFLEHSISLAEADQES